MSSLKPAQVPIPITHRETDGIGFGVLEDGSPYVSLRGLARLCGVHHSTIQELREKWQPGAQSGRDRAIADVFVQDGVTPPDSLTFDVTVNGTKVTAFGEAEATAVLHYYVTQGKPEAINTMLRLFRAGLRTFVYQLTGYQPGAKRLDYEILRRLDINDVPIGYFSILIEGTVILQAVRRAGGELGPGTMPDISVGMMWGKYWRDNNLESKYGQRYKHEHNFPEDYPQAEGFQKDAWVYPDGALPTFRSWLYSEYINKKFPAYIKRKVDDAALAESVLRELRSKPKLPGSPN